MGLDTTHECWHGAYSAFHHWRCKLAECAKVPLELMSGFYDKPDPYVTRDSAAKLWVDRIDAWLPLEWDSLRPDPIHILLNHSDCDGIIAAADCEPLALRLRELLPLLPSGDAGGHIGNWRDKTQAFIDGLLLAHSRSEDVRFH